MPHVRINGDERQVQATQVAELVQEAGLAGRPVAVERNGEVVPKRRWTETPVVESDRFELVSLVGGG